MNPTRGGAKRKGGCDLTLEGLLAVPEGRRARIVIRRGRIAAVTDPVGSAELVLDDSHLVFPGFLDAHVHAREDPGGGLAHKETFVSAGRAALRGGVVAFADMPNTPVPPLDDSSYRAKEELAARSPADVLLYAGLGPGTRPLSRNVPYKAYLGPTTGALGLRDPDRARAVLREYRGRWVAFHAESGQVLREAAGGDRSPEAEVEGIRLALRLAREFSLRAHIAHVSTAAGIDLIRAARAAGQPVSCEATPHHLFFDRVNRSRFLRGTWLGMNPPLREPADREALFEALLDGTIDWIATDHAPHLPEEKERGAAGVPGLDTVGGFAAWLASRGIAPARIARLFSAAPGEFFDIFRPEGWGRIAPGSVGSLTVLKLDAPWIVQRRDLRTRCGWSPFEGVELPGDAEITIVRGRAYYSRRV